MTKKPKKDPRGGARAGAGRKPTGTAKEWTRVNVQKKTKELLEKIKNDKKHESIDSLILALLSTF